MNFWTFGIYDLFRDGLVQWILRSFELDEKGIALVIGGGFLLCIICAYLLGSISWAVIISRTLYHDDVREHGSGNAGTTNILRTYGKKAAALTFAGDTLKGVLAILIACLVFGANPYENFGGYWLLMTAAYLSAFLCILGHVFPCFAHFKGGKGFATLLGVILVLDPAVFLLLMVVYFPMVLLTHYISLSSITIALFYPVLLASFDRAFLGFGTHVLIALLIGLLITWCHRSNIKRLANGTERKFYVGKKKEEAPAPVEPEAPVFRPAAYDNEEE